MRNSQAGPAGAAAAECLDILDEQAAAYAEVARANIGREFPSLLMHLMTESGDFPARPGERTPVFYGSLDWHSCVEMHWLLVRLLRLAGNSVPAGEIRDLLDAQFTADKLAAEASFVTSADGRYERPYGWAWALALVHEIASLDEAQARRWLTAIAPLADALTKGFLDWLPKATYPIRHGVHANSAFGLSIALPFAARQAQAGRPDLAAAMEAKALGWFVGDMDYPAGYEPSGHDFLSPALTEAELMSRLLAQPEFADWLAAFLPGIADGEPSTLFTPAVVADASDGQIAHLHGLNASRAYCWRRIAESLPDGDARIASALAAARTHLDAALPHVIGDDYMVEHWLAAYAVLALT
ncbi:MAG TPA: DUF2891 domain-containing protein [Streptosporangiaceae bacterium]|nr:DUF2891 domain-containing protein [Streptosporangiaceae bacterium]